MARTFFISLCLMVGVSLTACFDSVPIFGSWQTAGLFSREIEFQPDRVISGNQTASATYEQRDGLVFVHLSNGRDLTVEIVDPNHIKVDGTDFRRVETGGLVGSLLQLLTSSKSDRPGSSSSGLFAYLAELFQSTTKASHEDAADHSLIAAILHQFGIGEDGKSVPAKSPAPAGQASNRTSSSGNTADAKSQAVATASKPMNVHKRPPAEPVSDLLSLPEANWKTLARYEATKLPSLSKRYLQGWYAANNCRVYDKDKNDEFAMAEHVNQARSELEDHKVGSRYRVLLRVKVGEYDFDKKAFALSSPTEGYTINEGSWGLCFGMPTGDDGIPDSFSLRLDEDAPWQPSLPMAQDEARNLVQTLKANNRSVWGDLVVDLEDVDGSRIDARPVALYLWKDDKRHVFLGALGRANPGSESIQKKPVPTEPAATSAPVTSANTVKAESSAPTVQKPQAIAGRAKVIDTATLLVDSQKIKLDGLEGLSGKPAQELQSFINAQGQQVNCTPLQAAYRCLTKQGVNIAEAAILNGAAKAARESSEHLRSLEQEARSNHRGIWAK